MNWRDCWNNYRNVGIFVVAGIIVGLVIAGRLNLTPEARSDTNASLQAIRSGEIDFRNAVQNVAGAVGPAVVSIHTEQTQRFRPYGFQGPMGDEFFRKFFEDFFGQIPDQEFKRSGFGSGVIIDSEGYILTNEHVVHEADKIVVTLADGRQFDAELRGTDPRSDLAVIQIEAPDLPYAQLGDSGNLKTGQWVVAIGNPFGHLLNNPEPTVTAGVISALRRSLPRTRRRPHSNYTDLIQTDAAINPGNSGGPLVNLKGEIVGINVAIFSTSGGYQGIGFAIPINNAKRIIENLIEGTEVRYGWVGVSVQDLDQRLADYFGLPDTGGVLVRKVLEDTPAAEAGLREGDVILAVKGEKTRDVTDLLRQIGQSPIGETVPLKVLRDKRKRTISVRIAKRPSFDERGLVLEKEEPSSDQEIKMEGKWRGMIVEAITPALKSRFNLEDTEGVIVRAVEPGTPAADAGMRQGDIITAVNNRPVTDVNDFNAVTRRSQGDALIRTQRGYLVVKTE